MTEEIIIAGFGGQGVLSMGKILAYSGIMQEQEVSWMPSYGPEMRGGTANVTVILSDDRVSSPVLKSYDTAILLNQQSLDKFESMVKPGGLLIYDPNGITRHPERKDIRIFQVEATEEAARLKSRITFNMVVLGAYLKVRPVVEFDNVVKGLKKSLPERHHHLLPANEKAIRRGMEIVKEAKLNA
ncbi:MAG TPA: 2-oxoglutarate ferredoxin oxidoreductase subunit gamma [Bacteroides sp.]|nr:2-oxoglutarate ferredoxin oxidoreductase subunit gamma [Bacteroides sp.]